MTKQATDSLVVIDEIPGPFAGQQLLISGYLENKTKVVYLIGVAQSGQVFRYITSKDLIKAGYFVEPVSDCIAKVSFDNQSFWLKCGAPSQQVLM